MTRLAPTATSLASAVAATVLLAAGPAAAAPAPYATPAPTGTLPPAAPVPGPSIAGRPVVGQAIGSDRGGWPPATALSSEWLRCDPDRRTCVGTGDADLSYSPVAADLNRVLILRVVGSGATGARTADSAPTGRVVSKPVNVAPPSIAGRARVGTRLTARPGRWIGTVPLGFRYGWFACGGRHCTSRSRARTYTPVAADEGKRLIVSVLGLNAYGSDTATISIRRIAPGPLLRLAPFPRLIVKGRVAGATTTVAGFRFSGVPRGARVSIDCTGRDCPFRHTALTARRGGNVDVPRLRRGLQAGTMIVSTVRRGRTLGKYTRLRFRRDRGPVRVDRCVKPGSPKPVACS